jgi:RimJ/RimL family protein N-acetyltransferase
MWAIRLHGDRTVVGAIEFGVPSLGVGSVHYALGRAHWGRGLMPEAVEAVCRWAFDTVPTLLEVGTTVAEANVASARVLEKCGLRRFGVVDECWAKGFG